MTLDVDTKQPIDWVIRNTKVEDGVLTIEYDSIRGIDEITLESRIENDNYTQFFYDNLILHNIYI